MPLASRRSLRLRSLLRPIGSRGQVGLRGWTNRREAEQALPNKSAAGAEGAERPEGGAGAGVSQVGSATGTAETRRLTGRRPLPSVRPRWSSCWGTRSAPRWDSASVRPRGGRRPGGRRRRPAGSAASAGHRCPPRAGRHPCRRASEDPLRAEPAPFCQAAPGGPAGTWRTSARPSPSGPSPSRYL